MQHKIGHLFGVANIATSECVSTTRAVGFTQIIEIPIDDLKSVVRTEKEAVLWRLITMHIIKTAPDLFGPLKKFDRA